MAIMYPPFVDPNTKSYGEMEIFSRLKNDPNTTDWIVLHSLDIAEHRTQITGEVDFVVIIPGNGILCVEVKATNHLRREDGLWFYGKDPIGDPRGPFKQASDAMHSLRKKLISRAPHLGKIVFWSAVIFPYYSFNEKSPEWHDWQIIDRTRFSAHSISYNLEAVLHNAKKYLSTNSGARWFDPSLSEPSPETCRVIANILRPSFEFYEAPASRMKRRTAELKKYTDEQYDALDAMQANPRVIFQGPAGTGKTLLAIEAARRSALAGRKTLLICFNKLLGYWLKSETRDIPNLSTATLHSHMLSIAGIQVPDFPTPNFWESDLPTKAIEAILEKEGSEAFDTIIVDEAQDILSTSYLDFLDLSLKGGLLSGSWIVFGDFENQIIYERAEVIRKHLLGRLGHIPRYSLRINCRNTPRIAELVHLLGGLSPHYTRIRRPDNQLEPKILVYDSENEQSSTLSNLLKQLTFDEKYSFAEIVILSACAETESVSNGLPDYWQSKLSSFRQDTSLNKLHYGTIHSFKGMESPVVILTDIDNVSSNASQSLFYVGTTRALDKLIVLVSKKVSTEINRMLIGS